MGDGAAHNGNQRGVVELFAGVGGFRLGLERAGGWEVVWANQWEPSTKSQAAFDCYTTHFKSGIHVNKSITDVMDAAEKKPSLIPPHELVCGGFPCQDYSVAKTLSHARGLEGKKGVLWWDIRRLLKSHGAPFVFLENVDRLLKSPATQRGRDFAVILACLAELGYAVEWRVVNAAKYGFPQRRRRVFIIARPPVPGDDDPYSVIHHTGVLARGLPVKVAQEPFPFPDAISDNLLEVSETFGTGLRTTPFKAAGFMKDFKYWTCGVTEKSRKTPQNLGQVLIPPDEVPDEFLIPPEQEPAWRRLKGAKREPRTNRAGFSYTYNEGAVAFPDPLNKPSRTILTGEGGPSPSRFKHVVEVSPKGPLRRLTPVELEKLNDFPPGWTDTGMSDPRRAFMMGNALVVGLIERVGIALREVADEMTS